MYYTFSLLQHQVNNFINKNLVWKNLQKCAKYHPPIDGNYQIARSLTFGSIYHAYIKGRKE